MKLKPRNAGQPAFGTKRIILSSMQGLSVLAISLIVYFIAIFLKRPEDEIRALTFTTLIISNVGLILINRSRTRTILETFREKNPSVKWVIGGALTFLMLILFVPALRKLFHFDLLHADDLVICLFAGMLSIVWFEMIKLMNRRKAV